MSRLLIKRIFISCHMIDFLHTLLPVYLYCIIWSNIFKPRPDCSSVRSSVSAQKIIQGLAEILRVSGTVPVSFPCSRIVWHMTTSKSLQRVLTHLRLHPTTKPRHTSNKTSTKVNPFHIVFLRIHVPDRLNKDLSEQQKRTRFDRCCLK